MASIFTFQDEPHRVHSPWSTPGSSTPQIAISVQNPVQNGTAKEGNYCSVTRLEAEKHDGPIEYKLHLLLRWRRAFTHSTTSMAAWTNQHGRPETTHAASSSPADPVTSRLSVQPSTQPSTQNRQARLQQLTTQLLWRLQQSSPFHSSSNANLVLPILPEATPRLGVPDRPSKLLPGLEESQGALYEIGVADDGTLVGLADEEMEESLTNLRAMAASLGCVVDVHRRVIVGDCAWVEDHVNDAPVTHTSKLWVAEVLVRPDNINVEVVPADSDRLESLDLVAESDLLPVRPSISHHQQIRVALVGAGSAGKSSLLGTLTTSILDNGRGKSRLSLLKHRHEIASGVTSSVAQELLGYQTTPTASEPVVNYATGDVSSWPDIHNLSDKLVFLSDSPGLPRYAKSTFRALISWNPAWTMICIPADEQVQASSNGRDIPHEPNLSLAHLELCLKLGRPFLIAITKMDLANKTGLKQLLSPILSMIKANGKSPVLANLPVIQNSRREDVEFVALVNAQVLEEQDRMSDKLHQFETDGRAEMIVPIVMTSAVTGSGVASLHALLRGLPEVHAESKLSSKNTLRSVVFRTDEVFTIPPSKVYSNASEKAAISSGIVLCGVLDSGKIALGDNLVLGPFMSEADSGDTLSVRGMRRSSSHHGKSSSQSLPRSLSENFSKSLQLNGRHSKEQSASSLTKPVYVKVRVVSLRNLRLSVATLRAGDTGTVGIQTIDIADESIAPTDVPNPTALTPALHKARKGMVLTNLSPSFCTGEEDTPRGYSSFTASFPYADFGSLGSPPLILGGHAITYVHSLRAAVRVTAVALEDDNLNRSVPTHQEVFSFDDDDDKSEGGGVGLSRVVENGNLTITFQFVSTVEFLEKGDQVLVVPNTTPAGPISGPPSTAAISGFSGFVGSVSGVYE